MLPSVNRLVLPLSSALLLSGATPSPTVDAWLRARADDHAAAAVLRPGARAGTALPETRGARLWRERAGGAEIATGFTPPTSLAPLIRAVEAGVVNINTVSGRDPLGVGGRATGSGFILGAEGYVVTNNHVVAAAQQIEVRLSDGREFPADVVGRDPSTDVALLALRASGIGDLPSVYLGDSDALEVGDWVVAIGNPFGLDHSVSHGMISAKERVLGVGIFDDFIQTDALINPGNSGGPLFNMRGEVVGVTTAIISQGQEIGFAVPINMVKDLLPNLRENGRLERGWLGVVIDESRRATSALTRAAVVKDVYRGSPAASAGIRPGDRFLAVNGRPIESYLQLLRRVALLAPGSDARLTVLRAGQTLEVDVKLAERPAETLQALAGAGSLESLGLVVRDVTAEVAQPLGLSPYAGVLVSAVLPRSSAQHAGLRSGDLIVEVNRKRIQEVSAFKDVVEKLEPGATVLLRIQRGDVLQYVALKR